MAARKNPFAPDKEEIAAMHLKTFSGNILNKGFTAAFSWESTKGFRMALNQACHAGMSYGATARGWGYVDEGVYDPTKLTRVLNGVPLRRDAYGNTIKEYDAESVAFMEWAVYHSPYKDAFLSDDKAVLHDLHVTIGNPEKPANFMTAGLMLSRYIFEHPYISHTWFKFVEQGLHPDMAFLLAHKYYVDKNDHVLVCHPSHTGCIDGSHLTKAGYVFNFFQRKPQILHAPYVKAQANALDTYRIWDGPNDEANGKLSPFQGLPTLMTKLATPAKSANPFDKATAGEAKKIRFKDAAPAIVEFFEPYKEYIHA